MPHLKIRGMAKEPIIKNSKELIDGLTNIVKCDRTWFTIEHIETEYIFDGKIIDGYTFVELFWFERTPEVKKEVANFITKFIKNINGNKDCCVIFFPMKGENYCDNGEFF
ncbi:MULTISPECIES: DUF1904 domain-containing protein [Fusobacterium]|jgi:phenylpyruvate tautomerase PptA (4-oxalocrotonate tautomerase family)|uniref:DUF1904 domain-containing protein n=1 Tax=Fusobacterium hominis TaxID=2764326 RepID=A0A7G9GXN5_9FUSO|nr:MULTISPECIES: DUF1904 domain-containing protein [Fusobacterium]QNM15567.1 DUF1904 domain-containing protein [Fusobacterium hominis]